MVFGLLFLAVSIITLLILYNQGQLVRNRVQIENAADAAVYSQAKLAARNQNFIAYTNRAMVANEVSIGQMVALLSWAKHYKQVGAFTSFPLYTIPIAPPSPVTMKNILDAVTTPWRLMGTAISAPAKVMTDKWPTVISYFNGTLGWFQKVFALATLASQVELELNVIEDYEFDPDNKEMYVPVVGWYFFTQNALLTYFGENFSPTNLASLVSSADTNGADTQDLVADFLGDQVGSLDTMINNNSPGSSSKKNASGGKNAYMNGSDDNAVAAYQRYAAIVNNNRESFTADRHWDVGDGFNVSFPLTLPLGIITLKIQLDLGVWAGIKNDGGTAYVSKGSMTDNSDIDTLGWSSIDFASFGIEFSIGLFVNLELCLPIIGCNDWDIIDVDFKLPIALPLAGSTHQVVSSLSNAKKTAPEWGAPYFTDEEIYGGDKDDRVNDGAFDPFHIVAYGWGQVAPLLPGGMYGANAAADVTTSYNGPPSFYSLGDAFQASGVGYEYTIALAKTLDDVETTDSDTFNIQTGDETDWDDGNIDYTRFDVQTHSRAEGEDFAGDYQQVIWADERPMMTVSSAETYFANPMQTLSDGSSEPASLFSPFWDARLREPSAIALMIASGEIDWEKIFDGLSGAPLSMVEWLLDAIGTKVVDTGVDYLVSKIDPPFDSVMEPPLRDTATSLKDEAVGAAVDQLGEFLP